MEDIDLGFEHGAHESTPVWAVFGDLMSGLLGAFVIILVGVLGVQLELATSLEAEIQKRQQEEQRREALEKALAGPLAEMPRHARQRQDRHQRQRAFRAQLPDQLQPEGKQQLLQTLAPITAYLGASEQLLMVSGFTDDMPVRDNNRKFADNWELSAQRALTVTRTLIEEGVPSIAIFAAAFGSQQPSPTTPTRRPRRKRRVEWRRCRKAARTVACNE